MLVVAQPDGAQERAAPGAAGLEGLAARYAGGRVVAADTLAGELARDLATGESAAAG